MIGSDGTALGDPVGASLRTHHRHLARRHGQAAGYLPEVATFTTTGAGAWPDLARLLGPGGFADLFSLPGTPPADWPPVFSLDGLQMIRPGSGFPAEDGPGVVELGAADLPEMTRLVERTRPGPFGPRTPELGTYLGVREHGRLIAMAGERLHPPGWTEISTVCTAPEARGRGHAGRLVRALAARITARHEQPFLHVAAANAGAIALYERLGFEVREPVTFRGFRIP